MKFQKWQASTHKNLSWWWGSQVTTLQYKFPLCAKLVLLWIRQPCPKTLTAFVTGNKTLFQTNVLFLHFIRPGGTYCQCTLNNHLTYLWAKLLVMEEISDRISWCLLQYYRPADTTWITATPSEEGLIFCLLLLFLQQNPSLGSSINCDRGKKERSRTTYITELFFTAASLTVAQKPTSVGKTTLVEGLYP